MRLLLIEDDQRTADYIKRGAMEDGHVVDHASNGRDGLFLATGETYDVLIVDRMLPGLDGLSLVKSLRSANVRTPILFLTTMSGIDDRVEGLNAGADDYLNKPFSFQELLARLQALARRPPLASQPTTLRVADLELDRLKRTVKRSGTPIALQPREYRLLEFLMKHANQVVTRTMLLENVWDFHFDPKTNVVETHISRLRSKINAGRSDELIRTVRGSGYSLHAAD